MTGNSKTSAIRHPPARFWAVDLHVHTPASKDVTTRQYGEAQPADVVRAAVDAGLGAIAVTDHNTAEWCDEVARAAHGTDLVVLPGVEITTIQGHLLAVFPEGTTSGELNDVLARVGIGEKARGDLQTSTEHGFLAVAKVVAEDGGLAIPAHVDGPKGLMSVSVAKSIKDCLAASEIGALEIVHLDSRESIQAKTIERNLAFVRGSDCIEVGKDGHRLSGIGSRRTWIKASRPDFRGIVHALRDPELRVRLELPPPTDYWFVKRVTVSGGFLDGQTLELSPDLTCLLGGTGTGKSLTLELIRFALDQQTPFEGLGPIRDEVQSRLENALGKDASVELQVVSRSGASAVVRRAFSGDDSPAPEVTGIKVDDLVTNFPIRAFSQGEVIEYARQPIARLSLIDDTIDLEDERAKEENTVSQLNENGRLLAALRQELADSTEELRGYTAVRARLRELQALFKTEAVKDQEKWTAEKVAIDGVGSKLPAAGKVKLPEVPKFVVDNGVEANHDIVEGIARALEELRQAFTDASSSAERAREKAKAEIDRLIADWKIRKVGFDQQLAEEVQKVDSENPGLQALRVTLTEVQERKAHLDAVNKRVKDEVLPGIERTTEERDVLLAELIVVRKAIRNKRSSRISELNAKTKPAVRIKLVKDADYSEFLRLLTAVAKQSSIKGPTLKAIASTASPIKLGRSYLNGDVAGVAAAVQLEEWQIRNLFDHVRDRDRDEDLLELQTCDRGDLLEIEFREDNDGPYAKIETLSHGQKCTAILIVALADGSEPLIIDQPEDALHAPWIEDHLVGRLRDLRGTRQFVFATRSPGLVVSADAEMLVTLRSEAARGSVEAAGSLERHELNELALYHLEGGSEAFMRRYSKLEGSIEAE